MNHTFFLLAIGLIIHSQYSLNTGVKLMLNMKTNSLVPGLVVGKNVVNHAGKVLVGRGFKLNARIIKQLKDFGVADVQIMQSTDVLPPEPTKTLRRDSVLYQKESKAEENMQTLLENVIRDELKMLTYVQFQSIFCHSKTTEGESERFRELVEACCTDLHFISTLTLFKGIDRNYLSRYSKTMALSLLIGIDLGLEHDRLLHLGKASMLYNCGHTLQINARKKAVLERPERASAIGKEMYEKHTTLGHEFLKKIFPEEIARVALEHHERVGGGGIPNNRSGSEISLVSKIVAVSGKFYSLKQTTDHRYAIPKDLAFDYILTGEGFIYDPNVINSFRKFIHPYPIGSVLEMSDGSRGLVIKLGAAPDYLPFVRVMQSPTKRFEPGSFVQFCDNEECFIKSE
jgi:HD-GYP domain-containing protein (c-di-GMP phosphodiesterase class II)